MKNLTTEEVKEMLLVELKDTLLEIEELKSSIQSTGRTYKKDGFVKPNPAVSMLKDAQRLLVTLCSKLQLTPKDITIADSKITIKGLEEF